MAFDRIADPLRRVNPGDLFHFLRVSLAPRTRAILAHGLSYWSCPSQLALPVLGRIAGLKMAHYATQNPTILAIRIAGPNCARHEAIGTDRDFESSFHALCFLASTNKSSRTSWRRGRSCW